MPLPFLQDDSRAHHTSVALRPPDDSQAGLMAAALDLLNAVNMKDTKGMADALRAAFEILDSSPHLEGPHLGEE